MVRVLQILGVGAVFAAGGILTLSVSHWRQDDPQLEEIRNRPSAVEMFKAGGSRVDDPSKERPPLVVQAEAFALLLNPPKSPETPPALTLAGSPKPALPPIRPLAPSANFKLRATSYYPNQPDKSMALIAEAGAAEGTERWVKEGAQLGHFVVQEIRRGSITYRDGSNVREMTVEPVTNLPNLVRGVRPGARQVSAAGRAAPWAAVDTNGIELGSRN
jgi:hypothetical protein